MAETSGLRRLTDRDDLLGWEGVGRLEVKNDGYCTGTLIAADLVLTAAHCVYKRSGKLAQPEEITFRAGLRDGVSIAERQALQIAVDPIFTPGGRLTSEDIRHDVALVRLRAPITLLDADPFALHSGDPRGHDISVTSYGRGRDKALSRQRHCNILDEQRGLYVIDCNVTFGSSGAPVFVRGGTRGRILALVSGSGTYGGRKVAFGMALPQRVAELKAQLRRNRVSVSTSAIDRKVNRSGARSNAKFVRAAD
ncbi:trypsin-like serine peptidase [Epibacterium ulvae]|uniref:trypsin-like serine peptidase n=1 Tax=Epibacterium ulvae TaxID=1156985 RepID=UPI00203CF130|nr:trypsin-like peptidase domain-containing protein [Epibacterium ulvae]